MRLEWPLLLLTLLLVPLALAGYLALERRRSRYALRFTNLDVLSQVVGRSRPWRRYVPPALFLLALAALLAALARPQVSVLSAKEDASIVLAVDTSGSMLADDVKPTRLAAAQAAVRRFLDRLPAKFRVGMVTFSSEAQVAAPLTRDRQLVRDALGFLYPGAGTAIGDALARSVEVARGAVSPQGVDGTDAPPATSRGEGDGEKPLTAILLLSDGFQTRGTLQPLEGAQRAKSFRIPVYTVALGTPRGTVTFSRGAFSRTIPVPPDPETLEQIADLTGGEFFAVSSGAKLNAVYEHLGSRLGRAREWREATFAFLGGGALLLLASGILSARWLSRLP